MPINVRNRPCQVRGQGVPISVPGVEHSLAGVGGLDYAAYEACFEAKISEGSRTGGGSRRRVLVAGGRRIRGNRCAGRGSTVVGYLPAPNHPQRGRNRRRQLGDVLRLRQGKRRNAPTWRKICPRLWTLRGLQRLRQRLPLRRRVRRLRLRRLRLLLVVGSLPYLLDLARSDYVDRRKIMAGLIRFDPANYVLFAAPRDGRVNGQF